METKHPPKIQPDAFDIGAASNPHADLDRPFTPDEKASFRRDLADAIPISGVDVAGMGDRLVLEQMPTTVANDLTRYIEHRLAPGGFLHAMLAGDLLQAEYLATDNADEHMPIICYWIWRYAPRESFGSAEAVNAWIGGQR